MMVSKGVIIPKLAYFCPFKGCIAQIHFMSWPVFTLRGEVVQDVAAR